MWLLLVFVIMATAAAKHYMHLLPQGRQWLAQITGYQWCFAVSLYVCDLADGICKSAPNWLPVVII